MSNFISKKAEESNHNVNKDYSFKFAYDESNNNYLYPIGFCDKNKMLDNEVNLIDNTTDKEAINSDEIFSNDNYISYIETPPCVNLIYKSIFEKISTCTQLEKLTVSLNWDCCDLDYFLNRISAFIADCANLKKLSLTKSNLFQSTQSIEIFCDLIVKAVSLDSINISNNNLTGEFNEKEQKLNLLLSAFAKKTNLKSLNFSQIRLNEKPLVELFCNFLIANKTIAKLNLTQTEIMSKDENLNFFLKVIQAETGIENLKVGDRIYYLKDIPNFNSFFSDFKNNKSLKEFGFLFSVELFYGNYPLAKSISDALKSNSNVQVVKFSRDFKKIKDALSLMYPEFYLDSIDKVCVLKRRKIK